MKPDTLLYGAAYYPEYLPCDRMREDFRLMRAAGFNLIRVAESTWSTWEPRDGEFDFTLLHALLREAQESGLRVIVGTPTYAIPVWLARKYPDVMALTHAGRSFYGGRQQMDITHPGYLYHAERIIRALVRAVRDYPCVIGYQIDNETKPYDTCSARVQAQFRAYLREKFGTIEAVNAAFGFAYWSNSVTDFDELPDVRGTVSAGYDAEFRAFQRALVTRFQAWQAQILREEARGDQFLTHNYDFAWRNYSFGYQPEVDQFAAARAVDIAGVDVYHPTGAALTGAEISFGGDLGRSLKGGNYFVLETQAQGTPGNLPYPGQLRLQAFAHLACGADCVEYWHWHSIHSALESYWCGVLPHDFTPGLVYAEAAGIGRDLARLSPKLLHLRKRCRVALLLSNRSLTALSWFPSLGQPRGGGPDYNDYLRRLYDALYRLNVETDFLTDETRDFSRYDLVILPSAYCMDDALTRALRDYVCGGGRLLATMRTAFADESLQIYADAKPHGLTEVFGMSYREFTKPAGVRLPELDAQALDWIELLRPNGAQVLAHYDGVWSDFAAVTLHRFGAGSAAYIGCALTDDATETLLARLLPQLGVALPQARFPVIEKRGVNENGREIVYVMNFSPDMRSCRAAVTGTELLGGVRAARGQEFPLAPWGVRIFESD